MSRCTMPRSCAYSSPFRSCVTSSTSCPNVKPVCDNDMVAQPGAVDVLHRDVRHQRVVAVFVDADDVRVMQPARGPRLVAEPRHELRGEVGIDQVLADRLDGHLALDVRVEREVDGAHRALAQDAPDLVLAEPLQPGHGRSFYYPSSIFIACTRLAFIRPIASVSTPISSLLFVRNSPASRLPRLTWSAMPASRVTRRMTIV